jgi:hypothetical protein
VEALLWLLAPFAAAGVAAVVLHRRARPLTPHDQRLARDRRLRRMAVALDGSADAAADGASGAR